MFFFFNDPATTEISTLPLHDALPISPRRPALEQLGPRGAEDHERYTLRPVGQLIDELERPRRRGASVPAASRRARRPRSEEHTSELQSRQYLVCRLLLEKKKKTPYIIYHLCPLFRESIRLVLSYTTRTSLIPHTLHAPYLLLSHEYEIDPHYCRRVMTQQ